MFQTFVFMGVSILFFIVAFVNEDGFQEGYNEFYGTNLNRGGLVAFIAILFPL